MGKWVRRVPRGQEGLLFTLLHALFLPLSLPLCCKHSLLACNKLTEQSESSWVLQLIGQETTFSFPIHFLSISEWSEKWVPLFTAAQDSGRLRPLPSCGPSPCHLSCAAPFCRGKLLKPRRHQKKKEEKKKKGYGSMCRLHVYRFISLPHNHTGIQVGSLTDRERQRVKGSNKGGSRDWWGRRGEEERQTLEIVGVLEKRRVWNERVNLQGNRLAFEPSFSVLQSKARIQHSETHMLYLALTRRHMHRCSHEHPHAKEIS